MPPPQIIKFQFSVDHSTLQENQTIPTNATLSKVSDFDFIMVIYENLFFYYFQVFERNEEICIKTNIAEKYYKIG